MFSTKKSTYHTLIWKPEKNVSALGDYLGNHIPMPVTNWMAGDLITGPQLGGAIGSSPYTITHTDLEPTFFVEFFQGDYFVKMSIEYVGGGSQRYYIHSIVKHVTRQSSSPPEPQGGGSTGGD